MGQRVSDIILITNEDVSQYALRTIVALRGLTENEVVVIKGRGDLIEKAIDVYNEVKAKLGETVKLISVNIGSERVGRRILPFIEIKISTST